MARGYPLGSGSPKQAPWAKGKDMAVRKPARRPAAPERKVKDGVESLRKIHATGKKIRAALRTITIRAAAEKWRTNEDYVWKMSKFADPKTGFTLVELGRLCRWATDNGRIVGFSLAMKLLTFADKAERMKFAEKVLAEGMSLDEVNTYLVRRFGRRQHGGRRPRMLASVDDMLVGIEGKCLGWSKLYDWLHEPSDAAPPGRLSIHWDDLSADLQEGLTGIVRAAARLQGVAAAHLGQSKPRRRAARP